MGSMQLPGMVLEHEMRAYTLIQKLQCRLLKPQVLPLPQIQDTHLPKRTHILILPKMFHQMEIKDDV